MRLEHTLHIRRALQKFPRNIQETFYKQIGFLKNDIRHPSLRAKKYDEATDVWQAPCLSKSKAIGYKQQSSEVGRVLQAMFVFISGLRVIHIGC